MKVAMPQEMRAIDRRAVEEFHFPGIVLMENAGRSVAEEAAHFLGKAGGKKRIVIFAGKGNNGGDGLVAARHLTGGGAEVRVFLVCRPEELTGDAAINLKIWLQTGGTISLVLDERDLQRVDVALLYADLVIDAIYGTGFKGAAMGTVAQLINIINSHSCPVLAIDLPSGVEGDTGRVHGSCIRASLTVAIGLPKVGLLVEPGASYAGRLNVASISLPRVLLEDEAIPREMLYWDWAVTRVIARLSNTHKGSYGHVLVVGGSAGLSGAVVLAGEGALCSGAGLVTLGVPGSLGEVVEAKTRELMVRRLPDTGKPLAALTSNAFDEMEMSGFQALLLGPGMSRAPEAAGLVRQTINNLKTPAVLDADALNAITDDPGIMARAAAPLVITPHPGEMARLLGTIPAKVQEDRLKAAAEAARKWKVVVVLKGARTVVAHPQGRILINTTGNPGMATAGSGDVLGGIIAALLAQGMDPLEASGLGVFAHGLAGDRAALARGQHGMTASHLVEELPVVWRKLEEGVQD